MHVRQDFLGPSTKAKAFVARYLSFRFPNIASSSTPIPALTPSHTGSQHPEKPAKGKGSSTDLSAKFGPGGKVHQKDIPTPSASGSGSRTPVYGGRQAGAVTYNIAEPKLKPKRVDQSAPGSVGGNGKGKQVDKIWDAHKSREVRRLEGIVADLKGLQNSEGKVRVDDEAKECFCQGTPSSPLARHQV